MLPGKGEGFIALVAGISIVVVMLSVALLIVVMSVMNGFRSELFDRITGLNGHAIVSSPYGGRLDGWQDILNEVQKTPRVTDASPLIEQPLLITFNGRAEAILMRGNTMEDLARLQPNLRAGNLTLLEPGAGRVAIGSRLAANIGASVGNTITIINPAGRSTPFGTVPRQIGYEVAAIVETGVFDYDQKFVVMPMQDAQTLLLLGDSVGMIELNTEDADDVGEILAPLRTSLQGRALVTDWRTMNSALFEALEVERVAMFFALSLIVIVAAFNILSSLVMLVRAKRRDIAIMRTMGATRRSLMKIFVTTGTAVGAIGTVIGVGLGFLILTFRQGLLETIQTLTGAEPWDPSVRFLSEMPAKTDPAEVLGICALALGLSFLATLYPSWKAASTDPVEVLRYE